MSDYHISYEFAGLRLFPESLQIEIISSAKKINLSPTHCRFLLVLAQNPYSVVLYDELRKNVWSQSKELDASLKRLIQTTKGDIVKSLKQSGIDPDNLIENIPGKGYRLKADVEVFTNEDLFFGFDKEQTYDAEPTEETFYPATNHTLFTISVGIFYGLLFAIGLILETAYIFDELGNGIALFILPMLAGNAAVMFFALYTTERFLRNNHNHGLFAGILILCTGALISCLIGASALPNEPVTAATFQTQPASAAFVKNVLIYFLPLGVFLILIPFYSLCGKELGKKVFTISPVVLLGVWFLALIYSILSTFYLFDNLLPSQNKNLFIMAAIIRFIVYFGLGLAVILRYHSKIKNQSPFETHTNAISRHFAVLIGIATIGFGFYFLNPRDEKTPYIPSVEITSRRDADNRLFVNIAGKNFEPETLQIRFIGGDCPANSPCTVPNGALQKHSIITTDYVKNVPFTLLPGDFYILAQKVFSKLSRSVLLSVR